MASNAMTASDSKALVLSFFELGLARKKIREAFLTYVSPDLVDHKQTLAEGTREGVVAYLEQLALELPACSWELARVIAKPEYVFLHAKFFPNPSADPYAVGDIFRIEGGLIVEHWDINRGTHRSSPEFASPILGSGAKLRSNGRSAAVKAHRACSSSLASLSPR